MGGVSVGVCKTCAGTPPFNVCGKLASFGCRLLFQLHPFVVCFYNAVLLGISQEPQSLLARAVVTVLQGDKEILTLHHLLGLCLQDVFCRLPELVNVVVMLAVVVAVKEYEGYADDYYN